MLSKKNYLFILFLLFLIPFSYSCNKNKSPENDAVAATLYDYSGLDGCSWVIKPEVGYCRRTKPVTSRGWNNVILVYQYSLKIVLSLFYVSG